MPVVDNRGRPTLKSALVLVSGCERTVVADFLRMERKASACACRPATACIRRTRCTGPRLSTSDPWPQEGHITTGAAVLRLEVASAPSLSSSVTKSDAVPEVRAQN